MNFSSYTLQTAESDDSQVRELIDEERIRQIELEETFEKCHATEKRPYRHQPGVFTPGLRGLGITAPNSFKLVTLVEHLGDNPEAPEGVIYHPVTYRIQHRQKLEHLLCEVDYFPTMLPNGDFGLIALAPAWARFSDHWPLSAEGAVHESIGLWGNITPILGSYELQFRPLENQPQVESEFPGHLELFQELLLPYVIQDFDHPLIRALLGEIRNDYSLESECDQVSVVGHESITSRDLADNFCGTDPRRSDGEVN